MLYFIVKQKIKNEVLLEVLPLTDAKEGFLPNPN